LKPLLSKKLTFSVAAGSNPAPAIVSWFIGAAEFVDKDEIVGPVAVATKFLPVIFAQLTITAELEGVNV
jgi:hypothetical protein